jgi:hypothetical protein
MMFIKAWASFVCGEVPLPPSHDRQSLRCNREAYEPKPMASEELSKSALSIQKGMALQFTPEKLAVLKKAATESLSEQKQKLSWLSTVDAVIALIWRASVRVRQIPEEKMLLEWAACNMRSNLPLLPKHYFGNAINASQLTMTVGDIVNGSLGSVAVAHRQSVIAAKGETKEDWLSKADINSKLSLAERAVARMKDADFIITDWSKFGYYTVDFGDGVPACCRRFLGYNRRMMCILDMPQPQGSSVRGFDVCFSLDEEYYERFVKDEELNVYARVLG